MQERHKRTELILGADGLAALQRARVLVVGLGAVGSYATEALARAGVGHLRLVDCDTVKESNLNRQLYALHSTLGQNKADIAARRVRDINPDCHVEEMIAFAHSDTLPQLFEGRPDVVVDAIDSLNPKVTLIQGAIEAGLTIFSSMGAARRRDPSAIRVDDISKTLNCPLARAVRLRLRRRGIRKGVRCVFSTEIAPEALAEPEPHELPSQGRARLVMGSLPTLTGIFGLTLAHAVIEHIVANAGSASAAAE